MATLESISAADFVKGVRAATGPAYELTDRRIDGDVDLRHEAFTVALMLNGCEFTGDVDLRYCEFEKVVDLTGCTFHGTLNAGDRHHPYTSFKKDVRCSDAVFHGPVTFCGASVDGSVFIERAQFLDTESGTEWTGATVGRGFEAEAAHFHGPANFNGLACWLGSFRNAEFHDSDAIVDLIGSSATKVFTLREARFAGGLAVVGCTCGLQMDLEGARFTCTSATLPYTFETSSKSTQASSEPLDVPTVSFDSGNFGTLLSVSGATFHGGVNFSGVTCEMLVASSARFENTEAPANFWNASVTNVVAESACFRGGANFTSLKAHDVSLQDAETGADTPLTFNHATIDWNLNLNDLTAGGEVAGNGLTCHGGVFLDNATVAGELSLGFARIDVNLQIQGATLKGGADLEAISIVQDLVLSDESKPGQSVSLRNASLGALTMGASNPFEANSLDLRGCSLRRFNGTFAQALAFARSQRSDAFSTDPFVQLRQWLRAAGDEESADQMYYEGRTAQYANAREPGGNVKWSWPRTWIAEPFVRAMLGYGVKPYRAVLPVLFFLALGALVFSAGDALRLNKSTTPTARTATARARGEPSTRRDPRPTAVERAGFDLDLFIPVVNLHTEDRWRPVGEQRRMYALIHQLAGWLLVPFAIAFWTGLARPR